MSEQDLYQTLGIEKNSSDADIKKAYRKLAMKYHPDRNPGDSASEQKFKSIQKAYAILSDKQKHIADYFAKEQTSEDENLELNWSIKFGSPYIEGAIAFLKANVVKKYNYGDHAIVLGEVQGIDTQKGNPLLYYHSNYLFVPNSS